MSKPLEEAIVDASKQIVLPTFVATLAIAIVWFPLFKLSGVSGWLFAPMAEAIIFAMLASFILSFTLLPTMAKYMLAGHKLPHDQSHSGRAEMRPAHGFFGRFQQGFERGFDRFRARYIALLEQAVAHRSAVVSISLAIALGSLGLYYFSGRDFFPEIRSGTLQMHMRAPLGTRIEVAGRIASLVSKDIEKMLPGQVTGAVSNCGLPVGPHNLAFIPTPTIGMQDCDITISLKNEKSPVWEYRRILRKGLQERYPGTEFTFQPADLTAKILNFGAPAPIDVQVNGPDVNANYEFARTLKSRLSRIPGATDVVIQQTMRTPTMLVEADRALALGLNLTQKDIAWNMLLTTAGSQQIDQLNWYDRQSNFSYRINIYTPQPQITNLKNLMTVPINGGDRGTSVQLLGNVTKSSTIGTPGVVTHGNLLPLFDIYVSAERRDLGGVLADVEKVVRSIQNEMPRSAAIKIRGQAEMMQDSYIELVIGLMAAIVLVYFLIVVNFQSWLDPFIIITALPGALAGIAWILFVTHTDLSVPALTGAIMTMGTATANSILVVAYARERLAVHGDALQAAVEAGKARIRPVLMTASAMIIGMVPMATGPSQNAPLGLAVMGGLLVATLFTLVFVPCIYAIIYNRRSTRQKESV
jgi:multidrug efflux pump subunit AcrB